jgi:hypothetical protein
VHACDVFGDDGDVAIVGLHHFLLRRLNFSGKAQDVPGPQRQRHEGQQRHPGAARGEQNDITAHDHDDFAVHQNGRVDEHADVLQVAEGAVNELAGGEAVVKSEADALELVVHRLADVIDHLHAHFLIGHLAEISQDAEGGGEDGEHQDVMTEENGVGIDAADPGDKSLPGRNVAVLDFLDVADNLSGLAHGEDLSADPECQIKHGEEDEHFDRRGELEHPAHQLGVGGGSGGRLGARRGRRFGGCRRRGGNGRLSPRRRGRLGRHVFSSSGKP